MKIGFLTQAVPFHTSGEVQVLHAGGLLALLTQLPPKVVHNGGLSAPFRQFPSSSMVHSGGLTAPF